MEATNATKGKVKTLQFYTIGESYQRMMEDFFKEGSFERYEKMCQDGNFTEEQMKKCFELKLQLTGDSRDEEGMNAKFVEQYPVDFKETLFTAIRTATQKHKNDYEYPYLHLDNIAKENKDVEVLLKYYSQEEINTLFSDEIILDDGYLITTLFEALQGNRLSEYGTVTGLILQDGRFIQCESQGHRELWPLLVSLKLVDTYGSREGHHDGNAVVVSSNQICGSIGFELEYGDVRREDQGKVSLQQLIELYKCREYNLQFYSSSRDKSVSETVREYYVNSLNMGGKYGNLEFLKNFYPHIPLCKYYNSYLSFEPEKIIVRTSPKKSLPGLLNSIVCHNVDEIKEAIQQIKSDFTLVENVRKRNEIYWFYQEFLEGQNGVVNCFEKAKDQQPGKTMSQEYQIIHKYDIHIACSNEQGAIVQGKTTNYELSPDESSTLRKIARELAEDVSQDIQLEFVRVGENDIRIVQFRTLPNKPNVNHDVTEEEIKDALVIGQTFSTGYNSSTWFNYRDIAIEDILVVEQDGESSLLLGKKALIVTNDTTFSHLLALSKALGIPSIYGTGPVDFKGRDTVNLSVERITGYIK